MRSPPSSGSSTSSHDVGTPDYSLCWSLALHRAGNEISAATKLRQAMLSNLYLVPHMRCADLRAGHLAWVQDAEPSYVDHIPDPHLMLWTDEEREWASGLYRSPGFQSAPERYIEISK